MAPSRAFTSLYAEMSELGDRAIRTVGGVNVYFNILNYPSPDACKRAADGFRRVFVAMRAQDRNRTPAAKRERKALDGADPMFTFAKSEYDKLHCYIEPLEDGSWRACMIRAPDYMAALVIEDRETGVQFSTRPSSPCAAVVPQTLPAPLINSEFDPAQVSLGDMFGDDEQ